MRIEVVALLSPTGLRVWGAGAWDKSRLAHYAEAASKQEALYLLEIKLLDEIDALTEAARQAREMAKEAEQDG